MSARRVSNAPPGFTARRSDLEAPARTVAPAARKCPRGRTQRARWVSRRQTEDPPDGVSPCHYPAGYPRRRSAERAVPTSALHGGASGGVGGPGGVANLHAVPSLECRRGSLARGPSVRTRERDGRGASGRVSQDTFPRSSGVGGRSLVARGRPCRCCVRQRHGSGGRPESDLRASTVGHRPGKTQGFCASRHAEPAPPTHDSITRELTRSNPPCDTRVFVFLPPPALPHPRGRRFAARATSATPAHSPSPVPA